MALTGYKKGTGNTFIPSISLTQQATTSQAAEPDRVVWVSGAYNSKSNDYIALISGGGPITLPSNPVDGDYVVMMDIENSWKTIPATVKVPDGSTVTIANDQTSTPVGTFVLDPADSNWKGDDQEIRFIYRHGTRDWRVLVEQRGGGAVLPITFVQSKDEALSDKKDVAVNPFYLKQILDDIESVVYETDANEGLDRTVINKAITPKVLGEIWDMFDTRINIATQSIENLESNFEGNLAEFKGDQQGLTLTPKVAPYVFEPNGDFRKSALANITTVDATKNNFIHIQNISDSHAYTIESSSNQISYREQIVTSVELPARAIGYFYIQDNKWIAQVVAWNSRITDKGLATNTSRYGVVSTNAMSDIYTTVRSEINDNENSINAIRNQLIALENKKQSYTYFNDDYLPVPIAGNRLQAQQGILNDRHIQSIEWVDAEDHSVLIKLKGDSWYYKTSSLSGGDLGFSYFEGVPNADRELKINLPDITELIIYDYAGFHDQIDPRVDIDNAMVLYHWNPDSTALELRRNIRASAINTSGVLPPGDIPTVPNAYYKVGGSPGVKEYRMPDATAIARMINENIYVEGQTFISIDNVGANNVLLKTHDEVNPELSISAGVSIASVEIPSGQRWIFATFGGVKTAINPSRSDANWYRVGYFDGEKYVKVWG